MYTIVHGMHLPNEQHCIAILANLIDMSSFMHEMPCLIYSLALNFKQDQEHEGHINPRS